VEIVCGLGEESTHTYDLTVTALGQAPVELTGLACGSDEFLSLNWLGFISIADADVVWYLDNVSVTNEAYDGE